MDELWYKLLPDMWYNILPGVVVYAPIWYGGISSYLAWWYNYHRNVHAMNVSSVTSSLTEEEM